MVEASRDQVARVDLPSGRVTLEPIDRLVAQLAHLNAEAEESLRNSETPNAQARLKLEQAGEILIADQDQWNTSTVANQVSEATRLVAELSQLNEQIQEIATKPRTGLDGLVRSMIDTHHEHTLEAQRTGVLDQLNVALAALADQAPAATVPAADVLRADAHSLLSQAKSLVDEHQAKVEEGKSVADEIQRRQAAMKVMGFDSLYTAAWLETNGPAAVESPLVLKPKEKAYVSVAAVLARLTTRTRYTGGSQGFSFPIGHTGIRYRVGSFNGNPVQSSSITDVDEGTVVLTNMRLAFIGKVKSVVTQLPKVVHVESYDDALAVFQEGRESPNFYKISAPQYFLLYMNWVLGHQA